MLSRDVWASNRQSDRTPGQNVVFFDDSREAVLRDRRGSTISTTPVGLLNSSTRVFFLFLRGSMFGGSVFARVLLLEPLELLVDRQTRPVSNALISQLYELYLG